MLAPDIIQKIHTYIDEGVPLEDLFHGSSKRYISRIQVAEKVFNRLQEDPWLDPIRCFTRTYGRSRAQALVDKEVLDMFLQTTSNISRPLLEHRRVKMIETEARIAEQTGDWKVLDKALSHLERHIEQLPEERDDAVKNTAALPAVLVDVSVIDPSKHSLPDDQFRQLMVKYGGKLDQIDQMIQERKEQLLLLRAENEQQQQSALDGELMDDAEMFMDNG